MFTMYYADCRGNETNCLYPHGIDITDKQSFIQAVSHDYVCAAYKGGYRSNENFIRSNCLAVEVDNDHSENPEDWVLPADVAKALPNVRFAVHYSRHHMKPKKGKTPRPKYHVFFWIDPTESFEEYKELKQVMNRIFPYFDEGAMDAARFFFGTSDPEVEFYEGDLTLTQFLTAEEFDTDMGQGTYGDHVIIEEGRRNATMSRFAGRIVKRYGATEKAFQIFLEESEKCSPPLDNEELGKIWSSACRFAKKVQNQEGYVPPDQYKAGYALKPADYSDIGQAKVVAMDCANELAYSTGTDFMFYDGKRWVESKPKSVGCMENFLDRQLAEAKAAVAKTKEDLIQCGVPEQSISAGGKGLEKQIQAGQRKAFMAYLGAVSYYSFVMKRRDVKYINSALMAVKPMVEVETHDIDSHAFLLNCPDGTYDLCEGMAGRRDHDSADYITMITAYAPGDEGKDLWLDSINRTFQGDEELIDYVQQTVGLCAIGDVYQEALTISYGIGSNGKSTFWNSIAGAMGTYSGMISADALTVGCRRNVKPELAEVKGKRILIAAELEEGMRLSTSIVKQLSSTDEIEGEKKYKDPFKFKPTHTLVLYTNHLPKVGAMDTGIWRRLIVIPFNASIMGNSEIKNYSKYLLDNAGPYIVKWIIEGAEKAIHANFKLTLPACVRDAVEKYKADNDWMSHFLDECCEIGADYEEKSGELYASYRAYCIRSGEFIRSTTEFYSSIEQRGFIRHKRKAGRFVIGLRLADSEV